ncbi:MAG: sensor histidine kinase [Thainema sp.]
MFRNLRWRLLVYQLLVMASILGVFGVGVYMFVSRNLYQQLDKKLLTLAQSATPSFSAVKSDGDAYLEQVDEVPWRDIFNRDRQSLEWFDAEGNQLARRGTLEIHSRPSLGPATIRQPILVAVDEDVDGANLDVVNEPPNEGASDVTAQSPDEADSLSSNDFESIRSVTISVFKDQSDNEEPNLVGYIRASQSTEDIATAQSQMLLGLGAGGAIALGFVGLGGLWLTRKSVQPIEQSFRQLRQFTADASHELRSPLTAIQTSIDVILNHPERIHPKDAKKLAAISSATTQMSRLAQDLLLLARMDAPLESSPHEQAMVNLEHLLQEVIELLGPSAEMKDIGLKFSCNTTLPVIGDRMQLSRLFSNLVHNAIQYTPDGGTVHIKATRQGRIALVQVQDTGIGIAEDQLPHIFDRFWRADKARSRQEGGTGLGLAIVKAITQRHNGRISVTSTVGQGTCFSVRLPLAVTGGLMISGGS